MLMYLFRDVEVCPDTFIMQHERGWPQIRAAWLLLLLKSKTQFREANFNDSLN